MGLPSLPLTWWAENIGGPTDFGDYQIAHMPPAAACAGAARWAAKYKEYALLRSVFCRTACQHAADKPAHCRAVRGSGSGDRSGGDSLWAILRRITFGVKEFQRPWVFGGVFASFCRRGQKDVAPEREISPPEAKKRKQNIGGGRGRTPPLRRDRRECASIRRCADAGRRGRRPLRAHPSGCSGKRGAGDFRAYGGQARA